MKFLGAMKEKQKIVLLLLFVLLIALLNNHFSRKHYDELDKNMSSIYQDRLMPTSYLFQLSDHLYQKKILLQGGGYEGKQLNDLLEKHNQSLKQIIAAYEKTFLTKKEQEHWKAFVTHLQTYNLAESAHIKLARDITGKEYALNQSFDKALAALGSLNEVQTNEGFKLQHDSKSIINNTVLRAYLEVSLLFILGIIALRMLTSYEKVIYPAMGGNLMN